MVKKSGVPVFVIAGNHDSNERIEYAADLLGRQPPGIEANHEDSIRVLPSKEPISICCLCGLRLCPGEASGRHNWYRRMPFVQLATVKATMNPNEVNILIAHGYVIHLKRHERTIRFRTSAQYRYFRIRGCVAALRTLIMSLGPSAQGPRKAEDDKVRYSGSILKYSNQKPRIKSRRAS